ncbi:ATP synthase subunit s, mitochondrial [Diabrotica undecimpunctata]|uniref:ATP synthase subunit s, mitochondrial n=1 Tax=Diabrotica undecimpunctata TaxID=50387 RepID=UPI003B63BF03
MLSFSRFLGCLPSKTLHQNRTLFYWINLQFNSLDIERKKKLGPDRTCAEWILRNGGSVKFVSFKGYLTDYNELPLEGTLLRVKEVDASNTSIMHSGFEHFNGCKHIDLLKLHKCAYVDDKALEQLHYLKDSLCKLQVSCCPNVTDKGILSLGVLRKLAKLNICDLTSVKSLEDTVQTLKTSLPHCEIACSTG